MDIAICFYQSLISAVIQQKSMEKSNRLLAQMTSYSRLHITVRVGAECSSVCDAEIITDTMVVVI